MKNISFFLLLLISINIFAQAPYKVMPRYLDRKVDVNTTSAQLNKEYNEKCRSGLRTESYWVSYPFDYDSLIGHTASTTANFLFPDSNVYFNFSDGLGGFIQANPFVHLIGDVMNPLSDVFNAVDGVTYDENTPYMVDSAGMVFAYYRNTGPDIVDTLLVYLLEGTANTYIGNIPLYYYVDNFFYQTFGYDTLKLPMLKYNHYYNRPSGMNIKTVKVPLYESDTSIYLKLKKFATDNFNVPAGNKVGMAITFKPGYPYEAFLNISEVGNYILFASYEENGYKTYPYYYPGDDNLGSIVMTDVRYNINPYGWNNLFIPMFVFLLPDWTFERHLFTYHITEQISGVNEPVSHLQELTVTPNPAFGFASIGFMLPQNSKVSISISDLTGKIISYFDAGELAAGKHHNNIDVSKLSAGVYVVALQSGNQTSIEKLVIPVH